MKAQLLGIALTVAACNQPTTGEERVLDFTPTQCGYRFIGCDFADGVAVGGVISAQIDRRDGGQTLGYDLVTDSPNLAITSVAGGLFGEPAWDLAALAAGTARLVVIDGHRAELDYIDIELVEPTGFGFDKVIGEADGPNPEDGYDEAWQAPSNQPVGLGATARHGAGLRAMGRFTFDTILPMDSTLLAQEIDGSDRPNGYLYINPAIGSYEVTLEATGRPGLDVHALIRATVAP